MARRTEQCGDKLASKDGDLTCGKTRAHVIHKDTTTGDRFVRVPGGALIKGSKADR